LRESDKLDAFDLTDIVDNAFGETEPDSEILQVGGRRHHHSLCGAIIAHRDGHLLRNGAVPFLEARNTMCKTHHILTDLGYRHVSRLLVLHPDILLQFDVASYRVLCKVPANRHAAQSNSATAEYNFVYDQQRR
jgi:hypothetical protein